MAAQSKQPEREPDSGVQALVVGPGVAAEQSLESRPTVDVSVPDGLTAGQDFSKHPFPAGGVTVDPLLPPVDRTAALRALVSLPSDRLRPLPASSVLPTLPGRSVRDYRHNDGDAAKVYDVIAVRFNAGVGGNAAAKEPPRFVMCAAGDTVQLTDAEAAWGLQCGAIRLVPAEDTPPVGA